MAHVISLEPPITFRWCLCTKHRGESAFVSGRFQLWQVDGISGAREKWENTLQLWPLTVYGWLYHLSILQ